jgi:FAD binding domain
MRCVIQPAHTPPAHIVNQRTVAIVRALGTSRAFHEVATPPSMMGNNAWVTTLADARGGSITGPGIAPDRLAEYLVASPEPMANCRQTECVCSLGPTAMSYGAASLLARIGLSNYPTPPIVHWVRSHRLTRRKHLAH